MTQENPITPPKHPLSHRQEIINYGYSPERIKEEALAALEKKFAKEFMEQMSVTSFDVPLRRCLIETNSKPASQHP